MIDKEAKEVNMQKFSFELGNSKHTETFVCETESLEEALKLADKHCSDLNNLTLLNRSLEIQEESHGWSGLMILLFGLVVIVLIVMAMIDVT